MNRRLRTYKHGDPDIAEEFLLIQFHRGSDMLRNETTVVQRLLVTFLCLSLCLSFLPQQTEAQIGERVQIQIGKPSVWSMGQAHYLLADMRKKNRGLKTRMPDDTAL